MSFCFPAKFYLFKVNNRNTRERGEKYSKLTIITEQHKMVKLTQTIRSPVFILNFEHFSKKPTTWFLHKWDIGPKWDL